VSYSQSGCFISLFLSGKHMSDEATLCVEIASCTCIEQKYAVVQFCGTSVVLYTST